MTLQIHHAKVSGKPAGSDPNRVYGAHWDDNHTISGTIDATQLGSPTISGPVTIGGGGAALSIQTSAASALAVSQNGINPALQVDTSTASQVAGLKVTGAATGGTVAVTTTDSGTNTNLSLDAKGSGTVSIGTNSTGAVIIPGVWSNSRNAKTANYTLANTDRGQTLALGGSACITLTVNAASGYDANFACMISNEDTGRGKVIAINGYSNFILWPRQSFMLFNQNNVWQFNPPGKWKLTASVNFNVNHASGNNLNNDGLGTGSGAFATIQNAINVIQAQIDNNGFVAAIQNAAETFTESAIFIGYATTGGNLPGIPITGSPATPGNTVWQVANGQTAGLILRDTAVSTVNGFKFVGLGSGQSAIQISQGSVCDFTNIEWGAFSSGTHLFLTSGGYVNFDTGGTYVVSGSMAQHIFNSGPSSVFIPNATISVPNALTFSNWYQGQLGATLQIFGTTFTGTGAGAGSTGAKYNLSLNASAQLNSVTLPGATAGSTSTGGQVTP